ncbi:helix-hairpin-helix domain-containing protein [Anaerostipes sp.]|uniref:helix-hairpin-helix domain-containing protein n=1 Tax=Anaerostipes sp. TaxID=1872530 RepID=UPI0025BE6AA4|nr:helix-hairpin-helix domain-containing protein [Anaerostipes sp.]
MFKAKCLCIAAALFFAACTAGCTEKSGLQAEKGSEVQRTAEAQREDKICVYVCGSVKKPGVYEVTKDARIISAVASAGGFTKNASREAVNQAEPVKDGQQIYVPSKKEAEKKQNVSSENGSSLDGRINLNTASKEELMTLSGIGEAKASDIISYREENGSFQKPEDIMKIRGIKQGIYSKIKDMITV